MTIRRGKLKGLHVEGRRIRLDAASGQSVDVGLEDIRRFIAVRSGDSFSGMVDDFLILELDDAVVLVPRDLPWFGQLAAADGAYLERSKKIFQGLCGEVPYRWRSGWGLGPRVKPSVRPRAEFDWLLRREGGLSVETEPKRFEELQWND